MCDIKTGVELELWVVDQAGRLCDGQEITDAHERIEPEFIGPLVEVRTEPHENEFGLRRDLQAILRTAMRAANAEGKQLVPLGTPLMDSNAPANCERGRLFETIYGKGVKSAKNCAGTHIHFENDSVVDQLNLLTGLDPALALSSSSPYYCGEREEDCSRAQAYRKKCGTEFRGYCDLWSYTDSLDEWQTRTEHMYEAFKQLASERGVSAETVEEVFTPEDTVLNPVRRRECQPTVEWRAPDAALPSQIVQLATDVGTLVSQTGRKSIAYGSPGVGRDCIRLPEFSELRNLSRKAIESGLEDVEVRDYLQRMGFDLSQYQPLSPRLSGPSTLGEREARAMRVEQARRFRADVETLSTASTPSTSTAPTI
jgi:hypothetical protein